MKQVSDLVPWTLDLVRMYTSSVVYRLVFILHVCIMCTIISVKVAPEDVEYKKHFKGDETELKFAVEEHMYPPAISLEVVHSEVPKHLQSHKRILLHISGAKQGAMNFPIDFFVEKEGMS